MKIKNHLYKIYINLYIFDLFLYNNIYINKVLTFFDKYYIKYNIKNTKYIIRFLSKRNCENYIYKNENETKENNIIKL